MPNFIDVVRLTRDPEFKITGKEGNQDKMLCTFGVAIDSRYRDDPSFCTVVVWGKDAENCANYLRTGSRIKLEAELRINRYEDNKGIKRQNTELIAERVQFLSYKKRDEEPS